MRSHVQRTVARCFAALRPILSVRRSLSPTALETLVMSLVLTRLDYCNATLTRIPSKLLRCLQAECFCQDNRWTPTLTYRCPRCTASRCLSHPRCLYSTNSCCRYSVSSAPSFIHTAALLVRPTRLVTLTLLEINQMRLSTW
jgi:hypothetical protein